MELKNVENGEDYISLKAVKLFGIVVVVGVHF